MLIIIILFQASKAAQLLFFETLKAELGPDIGMTIITPGVVGSEMIDDHFWSEVSPTKKLSPPPSFRHYF